MINKFLFKEREEEIEIFNKDTFDFKENAKKTKEIIERVTDKYNKGEITYEELLEELGICY